MNFFQVKYCGWLIKMYSDNSITQNLKRFWNKYLEDSAGCGQKGVIEIIIKVDNKRDELKAKYIRKDERKRIIVSSSQYEMQIDISNYPQIVICNCAVFYYDDTDKYGIESLVSGMMFDAVSHVLILDGYFPLHASAVYKNGHSYILLGQPGAGKTVTALRLLKYGFKLQSDDRPIIKENGNIRSLIRPIHINDNSYLINCTSEYFEFNSGVFGKYRRSYVMKNEYVKKQGSKVAGFFFLERTVGEDVSVVQLTKKEAITKMLSNQYAWYTTKEIDLLFSWLLTCEIPFYTLRYGVIEECMKKIAEKLDML